MSRKVIVSTYTCTHTHTHTAPTHTSVLYTIYKLKQMMQHGLTVEENSSTEGKHLAGLSSWKNNCLEVQPNAKELNA